MSAAKLMADTTANLEQFRALASAHGVPLDCVGRLAVTMRRSAHLLDCSYVRVKRWVADGDLPASDLEPGMPRILVVDLLRFLEERRRVVAERPPRNLSERAESFLQS